MSLPDAANKHHGCQKSDFNRSLFIQNIAFALIHRRDAQETTRLAGIQSIIEYKQMNDALACVNV